MKVTSAKKSWPRPKKVDLGLRSTLRSWPQSSPPPTTTTTTTTTLTVLWPDGFAAGKKAVKVLHCSTFPPTSLSPYTFFAQSKKRESPLPSCSGGGGGSFYGFSPLPLCWNFPAKILVSYGNSSWPSWVQLHSLAVFFAKKHAPFLKKV